MNGETENPTLYDGLGITASKKGSRTGITSVEVLVVVAILAVIMALILPAVQQSRATARRIQCVNHLKQLVTASLSYHDLHRQFAPTNRHFVSLLPLLEQDARYCEFQETRFTSSPSIYFCPSDPRGEPARADLSYHLCEGSGRVMFTDSGHVAYDGLPGQRGGMPQGVRIRDVTDGTSSTAMYSERLISRNGLVDVEAARRNPRQHLWYVRREFDVFTEFDEFRLECRTAPRDEVNPVIPVPSVAFVGRSRGYNHITAPNSPGCYLVPPPRTLVFDFLHGSTPATSEHSGGVNVAFCDGHVQFVSDSIDLDVWNALGSRNGGEVVGEW